MRTSTPSRFGTGLVAASALTLATIALAAAPALATSLTPSELDPIFVKPSPVSQTITYGQRTPSYSFTAVTGDPATPYTGGWTTEPHCFVIAGPVTNARAAVPMYAILPAGTYPVTCDYGVATGQRPVEYGGGSLTVNKATQTQTCATMPRGLPLRGTRTLISSTCLTNIGQKVRVTVKAARGIVPAGDQQLVKVTTNATTGKVTIQTFGYQPVTVVVVIRASATANYKAYSISHRYYIR